MKIPLCKPIFDKEMENAAIYALQNEKFVLGESVFKFEEEFAKCLSVKHAISTNSGTSALHLSLIALGISIGESVITTPASFVATANAILYVKAKPVFADVDIESYTISPKHIIEKITRKVKVLLPVHLYGRPAEMDSLKEISVERGLHIVEDACQAHGAEFSESKVGTIGDVGCFSFYSTKNMTVCGDGGMAITNDDAIANVIRKLRDCGRSSQYEHTLVGFTARLNTVNAAIGRIQLKRLDGWNKRRREVANLYNSLLSDLKDVILPPGDSKKIKSVYHLYVIRTLLRDQLLAWLRKNGIECGIHYPIPIHLQPVYKSLYGFEKGDYPNSELLSKTCLSLPMFPTLTRNEVGYICEKVHEFFKQRG
jgi:perosamine synthetase